MKNIKLLTLLSAMILLFTACEKSDYRNVIPADAKAVVEIDCASLYEKGELSRSNFFAMVRGALAMSMDNGIDFRQPIYLFATADDCIGVAMKVGDRAAFESTLDLWRTERDFVTAAPVKRDGMMWTTAFGTFDLVYRDDVCLMVTSMDNEGSALSKQTANRLMNLDEDERFMNTDRYAAMQKQADKDIVAIGDMLGMPPLKDVVNSVLPKGISVTDVEALASLNCEAGKLVLTAEILSDDEKVSHLLDSVNAQFRNIEGRYIDAPAEDFLMWAGMGMKGDALLASLRQNEQIKQVLGMFGMMLDIDKMIKAVDGDIAVMLPDPKNFAADNDELPDFTLLANVGNTDFMADADYWVESMNRMNNPKVKMQKIDNGQYLLDANGMKLHWGVDGDNLFFASIDDYTNSPFTQRSTLLKEYAEEIQRNNIFIYINLLPLPMVEISKLMQMNPMFTQQLGDSQQFGNLKAAIFKSPSADKYQIELVMKDDQENFLKQILPKI